MKSNKFYRFGPFVFYPSEYKLLRDGIVVGDLQARTAEVLLVLIENRHQRISREEIIKKVWGNRNSVTDGSLYYQINRLRKILGDSKSNPEYIDIQKGRGLQFIAIVDESAASILDPTPESKDKEVQAEDTATPKNDNGIITEVQSPFIKGRSWNRKQLSAKALIIGAIILLICITGITLLFRSLTKETKTDVEKVEIASPFDILEVKRVVKESQIYETLTIYTNPKVFDKSQLSKYWLPAELGGKEIKHVEAAVENLIRKGWRFEQESKIEIFEYRYAKIFAPGDIAEVGTIERWYIPTCNEDGSRVLDKNVYLGPQAMEYKLRKINNDWLIEETTVPRPNNK